MRPWNITCTSWEALRNPGLHHVQAVQEEEDIWAHRGQGQGLSFGFIEDKIKGCRNQRVVSGKPRVIVGRTQVLLLRSAPAPPAAFPGDAGKLLALLEVLSDATPWGSC